MKDAKNDDLYTSSPCLTCSIFFFCWWRHNRLLMTSQWPDNGDAITRIVISNSLDIDFIHGDIHGGSCKKYQSLVLVCGCGNLSIPSIAISAWSGAAEGQAKCTASPFSDLDPRSQLWHWITKIACLHDKVGTTRPSLQNLAAIPLVMLITWLDFGEILLKFFFGIFCLNISELYQNIPYIRRFQVVVNCCLHEFNLFEEICVTLVIPLRWTAWKSNHLEKPMPLTRRIPPYPYNVNTHDICRSCGYRASCDTQINSLRPSDAYMRQ